MSTQVKVTYKMSQEVIDMPKLPLRFARGANSALSKCPVCDGGLDMISSGEGPALCPWCDSALSYDKFQLRLDTSVKAAAADGLTPHERRVSRQIGVTVDEVRRAKES